jgi:hypothetical protein
LGIGKIFLDLFPMDYWPGWGDWARGEIFALYIPWKSIHDGEFFGILFPVPNSELIAEKQRGT